MGYAGKGIGIWDSLAEKLQSSAFDVMRRWHFLSSAEAQNLLISEAIKHRKARFLRIERVRKEIINNGYEPISQPSVRSRTPSGGRPPAPKKCVLVPKTNLAVHLGHPKNHAHPKVKANRVLSEKKVTTAKTSEESVPWYTPCVDSAGDNYW